MTPIDALTFLDSIVAQVALNREQHEQVKQAVQALAKVALPKPGDAPPVPAGPTLLK